MFFVVQFNFSEPYIFHLSDSHLGAFDNIWSWSSQWEGCTSPQPPVY